jgi:hypothetical protein
LYGLLQERVFGREDAAKNRIKKIKLSEGGGRFGEGI